MGNFEIPWWAYVVYPVLWAKRKLKDWKRKNNIR
jgi:hypothetical protein